MTRLVDPATVVAGTLVLGALLTAGLSSSAEPAGQDGRVIPTPVLTQATSVDPRGQDADVPPDDPFLDELTRCLQDLAILAREGAEAATAADATSRPVEAATIPATIPTTIPGTWLRPQRVVLTHLSPEMIERCLEVARDIDERLAVQLEELRERDSERFEKQLRKSRRLVALAELKKRDAVLYDLKLHELKVDARVSELARQVRLAHAQRRTDARALEEQFRLQVILQLGFRYRTREDYVCRLREIVERLEQELEHDRTHFNEMLERRMTELTSKKPAE